MWNRRKGKSSPLGVSLASHLGFGGRSSSNLSQSSDNNKNKALESDLPLSPKPISSSNSRLNIMRSNSEHFDTQVSKRHVDNKKQKNYKAKHGKTVDDRLTSHLHLSLPNIIDEQSNDYALAFKDTSQVPLITEIAINLDENSTSKKTKRIQVVARIRPLSKQEVDNESTISLHPLESPPLSEDFRNIDYIGCPKYTKLKVGRVSPNGNESILQNRQTGKEFEYDAVLDHHVSQEDAYNIVCGKYPNAISQAIFGGYNAAILAYGQTGSGKTYTIFGSSSGLPSTSVERHIKSPNRQQSARKTHRHLGDRYSASSKSTPSLSPHPSYYNDKDDSFELKDSDGIIPRAVHDLFRARRDFLKERGIDTNGHKDSTVEVTLSVLELYNDEIRDLLVDTSANIVELTLKDHGDQGIHVANLTEKPVSSASDVMSNIEAAMFRRVIASTAMNAVSSRSHALCTLHVKIPSEGIQAKLTIVDLAGSERIKKTGAEGIHQQEGISINKDLFVLGKVVSALAEKHKPGKKGTLPPQLHIPYRDSKLTRILRDSLGGNCFTVIVACVSPTSENLEESVNTLRYAQRARIITNSMTKNVINRQTSNVESSAAIERLTSECSALKEENEKLRMELAQQKLVIANEREPTAEAQHVSLIDLQRQEIEQLRKELQVLSERRNLDIEGHITPVPGIQFAVNDEEEKTTYSHLLSEGDSVMSDLDCVRFGLNQKPSREDSVLSNLLSDNESYISDSRNKNLHYEEHTAPKIKTPKNNSPLPDSIRIDKNQNLNTVHAELLRQLEILKQELSLVKLNVDQETTVLMNLEKSLSMRKTELESEIVDKLAERDQLEDQIILLGMNLDDLVAKRDDLVAQNIDLENAKKQMDAEKILSTLEVQKNLLEEQKNTLASQIRTLTEEKSALFDEVQGHQDIAAVVSQLGLEQEKSCRLEKEISELEQKKIEMQKEMSILSNAIKKKDGEIKTLKGYANAKAMNSKQSKQNPSKPPRPPLVICSSGLDSQSSLSRGDDGSSIDSKQMKIRIEAAKVLFRASQSIENSPTSRRNSLTSTSSLRSKAPRTRSYSSVVDASSKGRKMGEECSCSMTLLTQNHDPHHVEFFLPKLDFSCQCDKCQQGLKGEGCDPTMISCILRPWQAQFLNALGIHTIDDLLQARDKNSKGLVKALMKWREVRKMTKVKKKSCFMAIHIWSRTAAVIKRSLQSGETIRYLNEISLADDASVSTLGCPDELEI